MNPAIEGVEMHSDAHRLGAGLSVRFSFSNGRMEAAWQPRMPTKREAKRTLNAYRAARQVLMLEVARHMGATVLCVELAT